MKFLENKIKQIIISALNDPDVQKEVIEFADRTTKQFIQKQAERFKDPSQRVFPKFEDNPKKPNG